MDGTKIQWTDASWNPLGGCSRVSEGCRFCYAEAMAARFGGPGKPYHGLVRMTENGPKWTGAIRIRRDILDQPMRWKRSRRIFVNSMSDTFHEAGDYDAIDAIFAAMLLAPQHVFQVLTKRPEIMRTYMAARRDFTAINDHARRIAKRDDIAVLPTQAHGMVPDNWPPKNVWLGVSVENQEWANVRVPILRETQAAVRFLSCEPLLGPLDLQLGMSDGLGLHHGARLDGISWVIAGGESGRNVRSCKLEWIRSIVGQCRAAGVACFVKQVGSRPIHEAGRIDGTWSHAMGGYVKRWAHVDGKGGDPAEWPSDLRVREWPEDRR